MGSSELPREEPAPRQTQPRDFHHRQRPSQSRREQLMIEEVFSGVARTLAIKIMRETRRAQEAVFD